MTIRLQDSPVDVTSSPGTLHYTGPPRTASRTSWSCWWGVQSHPKLTLGHTEVTRRCISLLWTRDTRWSSCWSSSTRQIRMSRTSLVVNQSTTSNMRLLLRKDHHRFFAGSSDKSRLVIRIFALSTILRCRLGAQKTSCLGVTKLQHSLKYGQPFFYMAFACCAIMVSVHTSST